MRYFKLIRDDVDVAPLAAEVTQQEGAWLRNTSRQDTIRVQRDTNTIFLRSAVRRADVHVNENQESQRTNLAGLFPKAMEFLAQFSEQQNAHLSRATIVRLKPHSSVLRHVDAGSYYRIRDRYHLVLHSPLGSELTSGGETVMMQAGELWWFDNKQFHASANRSDEWRVHYIFDLLPKAHEYLAYNPDPPAGADAGDSN